MLAINMRKQLTQKEINRVSKVIWENLKCKHIINGFFKDDLNYEILYYSLFENP